MGGKRKVDPAAETGKCMKYPSDFKERKPKPTEQKKRRNAGRRQKGMDGGEFRPNKHTKVYFGCGLRVLMMLFAEIQEETSCRCGLGQHRGGQDDQHAEYQA